MSSFTEYRNSRLGRSVEVDGFYPFQCWDQYADQCKFYGVPYANCTVTGYVRDIWEQRHSNGMLKYFDEVPFDQCQPGDIIVFQPRNMTPYSHIGTCASGNHAGQVLVLGQNQGSSVINEVWLPLTDSYPTVFRLKPKKPSQLDGNVKPVNDMNLKYRAHCQDIGWREEVHDGMIAGSVGAAKRLEGLYIDTTKVKGGKLRLNAKAHISNVGWVLYKDIRPDTLIGTVGKKQAIEAIELDVIENTTGKTLKYQVHLANKGWTGAVPHDTATGSTGLKISIEAIKIWLE